MNLSTNRNFKFKDEELPIISKFVAYSFRRDLADFTAFSPSLNAEYLTNFEAKITVITELVEPQGETLAKKLITERIYETYTGLVQSINHLSGYLALARKNLKISDVAFGLAALRKSVYNKDVEGVLANLHVVLANITTYKAALVDKGMSDDLINTLNLASQSLATDKQQQYEILSNRKSIVQNNLSLLNGTFDQMAEILSVGKILYKTNDSAKLADYTFTDLLKKVRQTTKSKTNTKELNN